MFGKIRVKIKGVTPLLMNKITPERLKKSKKTKFDRHNPEEEARESAYIDEINGKKQLYIPSEAVFRCIINAAGIYRTKKMGMKNLLAGGIRIEPEKIPLGTDKYEIDTRVVRIQRDAVLKSRAKVTDWEATFYIIYDRTILPNVELLKEIIKDAGRRFGLLDYRPQKGGYFGVFDVVEFEVEE